MSYKTAAIVATLISVTIAAAHGQGARAVTFGCDTAQGHECHFVLSYGGGKSAKLFTVAGGARVVVPNVVANVDSYMVAIDRDPPQSPERCGVQFPCKRAFVNAAYNN